MSDVTGGVWAAFLDRALAAAEDAQSTVDRTTPTTSSPASEAHSGLPCGCSAEHECEQHRQLSQARRRRGRWRWR